MTIVPKAERSAATEAFQQERWEEAVLLLSPIVGRDIRDRECGLMLSSALMRSGNKKTATAIVGAIEHFSPSKLFDSCAANGVHPDLPYERALIAEFMAENIGEIRQRAGRLPAMVRSGNAVPYAFVYWDSDQLPKVVSAARESLRVHLGNHFELIELSAATVGDWISLGEVARNVAQSPASLSDLIRLELLAAYGGIWIDSTCLLTSEFPAFAAEFTRHDFFLFTYAGSRTGSWFWWADPSSYRLRMIHAALMLWIERRGTWTNYFMFHDFVEMLYWVDNEYRQEWEAGLKTHPRAALALLGKLTKDVSDAEWNQLYGASPVHKLSWKYNTEAETRPNAVVARVISGQREISRLRGQFGRLFKRGIARLREDIHPRSAKH